MSITFRYVADTYAWIAYFNKRKFQQIIENEIIETPSIVIAEITRTLKRKGIDDKTINKTLGFVSSRGLILQLDFETAKKGGQVADREDLSLTDGIVYAYIIDNTYRLITGDEHFKNKKYVIFEKE